MKINLTWSTNDNSSMSGKTCAKKAVLDLNETKIAIIINSNKYNQDEKPISLFKTIKYELPYALGTAGFFAVLVIIWYIIGIPIGIGGAAVL